MIAARIYKPGAGSNGGTQPGDAKPYSGQPRNGTGHRADDHEAMQPGPFPVGALNATMRAIAEETATVHDIPIELPAMATVGTMAGALGKSRELVGAVNGRSSFGNLYVIAAAPKSTGKGATGGITSPLTAASADMVREFLENERPDLKVEKKVLEKEADVLYKEIVKGDTNDAQRQMLKARLVW